MNESYAYIVSKYSEEQLNKVHDVLCDMIDVTVDSDVKANAAIEKVRKIIEDCINYDA